MTTESLLSQRIMRANRPHMFPVKVSNVRNTDSGGLSFTASIWRKRHHLTTKLFIPAVMVPALTSGLPNKSLDTKLKI